MPWVFQLSGLLDDHISSVHVTESQFTHVLVPMNFCSNVDDINFERVTVNGRFVSG